VFGEVKKEGNNYVITLKALDVATGKVTNTVEKTVPFTEMGEAQLSATAASLVNALYKITPEPDETTPEEQPEDGNGKPEGEDVDKPGNDKPSGNGNLIWGGYSPRPGWKYAG